MNYVIQEGDTLSALARRFGTTVEALAQDNGIANPDLIRAGMTMNVPGDEMQPTTGAMPRARPQQTASAPLPRPRPEPASSGMGTPAAATARTNFDIPIAAASAEPISAPSLGSVMTGALTPVDYRPEGWLPVPAGPGVPHTQRWTQNRPGGPIGAPDGDPDVAATYGQPGLTNDQRRQYEAERPLPGNGVGVPTEPVTRGPLADVISVIGNETRPAPGDGMVDRRYTDPRTPRGVQDPTLAQRMALRDAMRQFAGLTEAQLLAVDYSNFTPLQWAAWNEALIAAAADRPHTNYPGTSMQPLVGY